jgi:hypothetical protein
MTSGTVSSTLTGMASNTHEKVRENRLRRVADRQGYRLTKSRRRDPRAIDYGELWLVQEYVEDEGRWHQVASPERSYDANIGPFESLDQLEAWLNANPAERGGHKDLDEWLMGFRKGAK